MKFYKSSYGVVLENNESFFRALRFSLATMALICIAGLYYNGMLYSYWYYWVALLFIVLAMAFMKLTIEIDPKNLQYRQGFRFLGMMTGSWERVKEFSYISIFPTLGSKERPTPITSGPYTSEFHTKELRVNLVVDKRKRILLQVGMELKKARTLSVTLDELLEIGVFDCTGEENVWLKPK